MVTKKGLTIVEVLISIVLLAIIMAATSSVFAVAIRNYQVSFAQSGLQKDVNLVVDDIARNVKQAIEFPDNYDSYEGSDDTLILALPAIDNDQNFIYLGSTIEKDYIIYQLEENSLKKLVFANPQSSRFSQDGSSKTVLSDVNQLIFTHNYPLYNKIETELTVKKTVSNTELTIIGKNIAVRRNEQ